MKYLFLDTNVLLHYQCFEDIPWQNLLKLQEDVTIVIAETVIAEVDKHKDGSRSKLRDRAKKMSSRISNILIDGMSSKVPVAYCEYVKPTNEEENRYDLSVNDNRIILSALHSPFDNNDIIVVSADNNLIIKSKTAGLGFYKMKEEYQIKGEPTEEEKELKRTKEELARWTNRIPDPCIKFQGTEADSIEVYRFLPEDYNTCLETIVYEESVRIPEEKEIDPSDAFHNVYSNLYTQLANLNRIANVFNLHSSAEIAVYNQTRKEYLDAYREQQELLLKKEEAEKAFTKLNLRLCNNGTAQTGNMLITIRIMENVPLYDKKNSITNFDHPELVKPYYDRTFQSIARMTTMGMKYAPSNYVSMMDASKPINKHVFKYQERDLIHGLQMDLDLGIYIDTRTVDSFDIFWSIADSELPEHKHGVLHVTVKE